MFLHPSQVFGETEDFPGQAPIALATGQVVTFNKAGVNRLADGGSGEASLDSFRTAENDLFCDFYHLSPLATFDDLGIEKSEGGKSFDLGFRPRWPGI